MKHIKNLIGPITIITIAVLIRVLPHPANFAPIAGMALFGGVYLSKKYAIIIPLLAMFLSDIFLGFHSTMPFVYGSFLLTSLMGMWIQNNKSAKNILCASLLSSVLFFIVTNFGVWAVGGLYPKTMQGLINCYFMAIPFFRNTLLGDLFYTFLFFGSFEAILKLSKQNSYVDLHKIRG